MMFRFVAYVIALSALTSHSASSQSVGGNCVYPNNDISQWGWDENVMGSCPPLGFEISSAGACIDTDGDGYGWNGIETCDPNGDAGEPLAGACIDTDGDGYGWNGIETCDPNGDAVEPLAGACIDTDGDGYGWNGIETCDPNGDAVEPLAGACIDTDGDGYGWNGIETCDPNGDAGEPETGIPESTTVALVIGSVEELDTYLNVKADSLEITESSEFLSETSQPTEIFNTLSSDETSFLEQYWDDGSNTIYYQNPLSGIIDKVTLRTTGHPDTTYSLDQNYRPTEIRFNDSDSIVLVWVGSKVTEIQFHNEGIVEATLDAALITKDDYHNDTPPSPQLDLLDKAQASPLLHSPRMANDDSTFDIFGIDTGIFNPFTENNWPSETRTLLVFPQECGTYPVLSEMTADIQLTQGDRSKQTSMRIESGAVIRATATALVGNNGKRPPTEQQYRENCQQVEIIQGAFCLTSTLGDLTRFKGAIDDAKLLRLGIKGAKLIDFIAKIPSTVMETAFCNYGRVDCSNSSQSYNTAREAEEWFDDNAINYQVDLTIDRPISGQATASKSGILNNIEENVAVRTTTGPSEIISILSAEDDIVVDTYCLTDIDELKVSFSDSYSSCNDEPLFTSENIDAYVSKGETVGDGRLGVPRLQFHPFNAPAFPDSSAQLKVERNIVAAINGGQLVPRSFEFSQNCCVGPDCPCEGPDCGNELVGGSPGDIFTGPRLSLPRIPRSGNGGSQQAWLPYKNTRTGSTEWYRDIIPPPVSFGEPHLITLDREHYSFQASGEFVLSKSSLGGFEIQSRQQSFPLRPETTVNTGVALRVGGDKISVELVANNELTGRKMALFINDVETELRLESTLNLSDGGQINRKPYGFEILWNDTSNGRGSALSVHLFETFLNLYVSPDAMHNGNLIGLLGNYDGVTSNDLRVREGRELPPTIDLDSFYDDFASSWEVRPEESLFQTTNFEYFDRPRSATVLDPFDEAEATAKCQQACNIDTQKELFELCVFDTVVMGDLALDSYVTVCAYDDVDPAIAISQVADETSSVVLDGSFSVSSAAINYDGQHAVYSITTPSEEFPNLYSSVELFHYDSENNTTNSLITTFRRSGSNCDGSLDISDSGRYVVFNSQSETPVPQGNGCHLKLIDTFTGDIKDIVPSERSRDQFTSDVRISGNGRYVTFTSIDVGFGFLGFEIIEEDTNRVSDVYVYDVLKENIFLGSLDPDGNQYNNGSFSGEISNDGSILKYITTSFDNTGLVRKIVFRNLNRDENIEVTSDSSGVSSHLESNGKIIVYKDTADRFFKYEILSGENQELDLGGLQIASIIDDDKMVAFDSQGEYFIYKISTDISTPFEYQGANRFFPLFSGDGKYYIDLEENRMVITPTPREAGR